MKDYLSDHDHLARFKRKPLSLQEAQEAVLSRIATSDPALAERVALQKAYRRRSAERVLAPYPVPHFRRSDMDGYAVRAEDVAEASLDRPVELQVVYQIACGESWERTLAAGEAIRIMTGAMLPEGSDAVVKLEATSGMGLQQEAEADPQSVMVYAAVASGDHITPIGSEIAEGQLIVELGQLLEAGEIALLAMFGITSASVWKRPKVAIIPTGKELIPLGEELATGTIWDSNSFLLLAQIEEAGGEPVMMPQVGDDIERLSSSIESAMSDHYDMVITIGGVSVGDHDILYDYTQQWEGDLLFNKLSMRPGSPTTAGFLHGKPVLALSGNPSACYVGCEMFARPVLLLMQGVEHPYRTKVRARLVEDYRVKDSFVRFVRGIMHIDEQGTAWVQPASVDRSNATISIRDANCLFVIPPSQEGMEQGAIVEVIFLGTF